MTHVSLPFADQEETLVQAAERMIRAKSHAIVIEQENGPLHVMTNDLLAGYWSSGGPEFQCGLIQPEDGLLVGVSAQVDFARSSWTIRQGITTSFNLMGRVKPAVFDLSVIQADIANQISSLNTICVCPKGHRNDPKKCRNQSECVHCSRKVTCF